MEPKLTHFDMAGQAIMVDISEKEETSRTAVACGTIRMNEAAFAAVKNGTTRKGDVLGTARLAGLIGLKRTAELIPLCHTILIEKASIEFSLNDETQTAEAICTVKASGKTGVEMEALCGVQLALLTIYDMCKALDKGMEINGVCLLAKEGGKSGPYRKLESRPL